MARQFVRRCEIDRRKDTARITFPVQLSNGEVILQERRVNPDRRLSVTTEEIELSSADFDKLFKTYEQH
jgi:hypothetical protein